MNTLLVFLHLNNASIMSVKNEKIIQDLLGAIWMNNYEVRSILKKNLSIFFDEAGDILFDLVTEICSPNYLNAAPQCRFSSMQCQDIIYMLVDFGIDIEQKNKHGNTCLFYAANNRNPAVCDILLQCGADMWAVTECGLTIYDYVAQSEILKEVKHVFEKFYPGLWKAVECENIYQVRKLINLWCRTDLFQNGITLKDLAFQTGNEEIISLILGIYESMKLVYYIHARNTNAVKTLLEECPRKLCLDLRKMSDRGAPIIYYLIQHGNVEIIELFMNHGCKIYTIMQDELGNDMPVFFTALKPNIGLEIVNALLPEHKLQLEEMLQKILYKGKTVLEVAFEQCVCVGAFKLLLNRGGPLLLCSRNKLNQTVWDQAVSSNQEKYIHVIDRTVSQWLLDPSRRQLLALYGWKFESEQLKINNKDYSMVEEFLLKLKTYQTLIKLMFEAVEIGDIQKCIKLSESAAEFPSFDKRVLWHGRVVGNGMPLLHKAVLHNRPDLVEVILKRKLPMESIDNLFDQYHRTALHYAYASSSTKKIKKILLDYGCSEHILDKMNKEPLDFRDKQDTPVMMDLLNWLKSKNVHTSEPDPWKIEKNEHIPKVASLQLDICSSDTEQECHSDYEEDSSECSSVTEEPSHTFCTIA